MNKKKSIALLIVVSVVLVLLAVATFAQFRIPFYKNGTRIYQSFLGAIELDGDLEPGVAYELTLKEDIATDDTADLDPEAVVKTLEYRLKALGYDAATVVAYREGETDNYSFRVEMRASDTAADDIAVAARYGELEFKDGKIVNATANDSEAINKVFDTDEGARYVGEFSLGVNPYITKAMGDILFDEKISGSIHFTPGSCYADAYNGNNSAIHWDLVLVQRKEFGGGEIYFDDVLIRKDGVFVLDSLKCLNPENLV